MAKTKEISSITIVGYASCSYFQMAQATLKRIEKHKGQQIKVNTVVKAPTEYRDWVANNKLAKSKNHKTSPACFVGDLDASQESDKHYLIGGATELSTFATKNGLVPVSSGFVTIAMSLVALIAILVALPAKKWMTYQATGLAPYGGGMVKDLIAYGIFSLPWLGRKILRKPEPSAEALEAFHDTLLFNDMGVTRNFKDSPHFAENFYFWANAKDDTSFLYTIRLSFYGINGSTVIPWFHFAYKGEIWDLPEEFENNTLPHRTGDERIAIAPGLGELKFECLVPMEKWKITYKGIVRNMASNARRQVQAEFNLLFSPENVFKYQIHWDELAAARAVAGKDWSAKFWKNLRNQNQERYASLAKGGSGQITFENGETISIEALDASRDHNFGIRNWRFIHTYIWFPPVKFTKELVIDGIPYEYLTGAMTMYGDTFDNLVVGGLMSARGDVCSWSGATPMRDIAQTWFDATSVAYKGLGDDTLKHGHFEWSLAICNSKYILDVTLKRGKPHGLWQHSFYLSNGVFEIHEAMTIWEFQLRRSGSNEVIQKTSAVGLFEFGKNLVGFDDGA